MQIDGWRYYNHAAIPMSAPHEEPNLAPINDGSIWRIGRGIPLLARWTTEFDCDHETNWWYVVKDTPFDINALKAKRRYEINKGIKNFKVVEINPINYKDELYNVQIAAFSAYPLKYRPAVDREKFLNNIESWKESTVLGAFSRGSGDLCGYALLSKHSENYVEFNVLKTNPLYEKNAVNAALVEGILKYFNSLLMSGGYICDGARSINHETAFQDYLEKYFGFRKAFCKLHIEYTPKLKQVIKIIYPIRKLLLLGDSIGVIHQINSVLRMEEIVRENNG